MGCEGEGSCSSFQGKSQVDSSATVCESTTDMDVRVV